MSAAIETYAEVDRRYRNEEAWHLMGEKVPQGTTSKAMMVAAGLDWEVALGKVYVGADRLTAQEAADTFGVYRVTDGRVFATGVSARYRLFQNWEGFQFFDRYVIDGQMTPETAGAIHGGAQVFALYSMGEGTLVRGERYLDYLLLTFGHHADTGASITGRPTKVKVVCANTLQMALSGSEDLTFKIPHKGNIEAGLEAAHEMLAVTTAQQRRMSEWLKGTVDVPVTVDIIEQVRNAVLSVDEVTHESSMRMRNKAAKFGRIFHEEQMVVGKTAYALVNAVTGYADHALQYNGSDEQKRERRFEGISNGPSQRAKVAGFAALTTATGGAVPLLV